MKEGSLRSDVKVVPPVADTEGFHWVQMNPPHPPAGTLADFLKYTRERFVIPVVVTRFA